jgi:hypothetical protein
MARTEIEDDENPVLHLIPSHGLPDSVRIPNIPLHWQAIVAPTNPSEGHCPLAEFLLTGVRTFAISPRLSAQLCWHNTVCLFYYAVFALASQSAARDPASVPAPGEASLPLSALRHSLTEYEAAVTWFACTHLVRLTPMAPDNCRSSSTATYAARNLAAFLEFASRAFHWPDPENARQGFHLRSRSHADTQGLRDDLTLISLRILEASRCKVIHPTVLSMALERLDAPTAAAPERARRALCAARGSAEAVALFAIAQRAMSDPVCLELPMRELAARIVACALGTPVPHPAGAADAALRSLAGRLAGAGAAGARGLSRAELVVAELEGPAGSSDLRPPWNALHACRGADAAIWAAERDPPEGCGEGDIACADTDYQFPWNVDPYESPRAEPFATRARFEFSFARLSLSAWRPCDSAPAPPERVECVLKVAGRVPRPPGVSEEAATAASLEDELVSRTLLCELETLRLVAPPFAAERCPFVARVLGAGAKRTPEGGIEMALAFRRAAGTLDGRRYKFSARACAARLLRALRHLHRHGVVHCDIKGDNVLVDEGAWPGDQVETLYDFDQATWVWRSLERSQERERESLHRYIFPYRPPELIPGTVLPEPVLARASDVWALGVLLAWFITPGFHFLEGQEREHAVTDSRDRAQRREFGRRILSLFGTRGAGAFARRAHPGIPARSSGWTEAFFGASSEATKDFFARIFRPDPSKRASAAELLAHPWLREECVSSPQHVTLMIPEPWVPPRGDQVDRRAFSRIPLGRDCEYASTVAEALDFAAPLSSRSAPRDAAV